MPFPSPGDLPRPRDWTHISCIGRWILYHWATWEALLGTYPALKCSSSSCSSCSIGWEPLFTLKDKLTYPGSFWRLLQVPHPFQLSLFAPLKQVPMFLAMSQDSFPRHIFSHMDMNCSRSLSTVLTYHSSCTSQRECQCGLDCTGIVWLGVDMVRFCPSNLPSVRVEPFWGACSPLSSPVGIFGSVVSVKYATYMAANGECPGSFSPPGLCRERPVRWHGNVVGRNRHSLYLGMKDHKWWLPSKLPINKYRECWHWSSCQKPGCFCPPLWGYWVGCWEVASDLFRSSPPLRVGFLVLLGEWDNLSSMSLFIIMISNGLKWSHF